MTNLEKSLNALLQTHSRIAVAFSGGRDSAALLHALAYTARDTAPSVEIVAIHINHGLQELAAEWEVFAQQFVGKCVLDGCRVRLVTQHVEVDMTKGTSVEANARDARYAALEKVAKEYNVSAVVLGHHRKDQAETFLLQALRGAGVAGLAAMPASTRRNGLTWCRPWLSISRDDVNTYVQDHQILFVEDPSNASTVFTRNKLRLNVLPVLTEHFPDAETTLIRSAQWCAEAAEGMRFVAVQDYAACVHDGAIDMAATTDWPAWRVKNLIRYWHEKETGSSIPITTLERILSQPRAVVDRQRVPGRGTPGLLIENNRLLIEPQKVESPATWAERLVTFYEPTTVVDVPERSGHWHLAYGEHGMSLPLTVTIGPRRPGLYFKKGSQQPTRPIKNQFQAAEVPATARDGAYMYCGEQLVWAPGLGLDARVTQGPGWVPVWVPGPALDSTYAKGRDIQTDVN